MLLICTAYGGSDERPAVDAGLVPLTPAFLEILKARQQLTQRLFATAGAETLDSLLFQESSPQWLGWSEELDEILQAAEATGWALVDDHRLASAGLDTLYEGSSFSEQAQAVDKAFHLLDGKGLPKYPGDFLTAIREAMRRSRGPGFAGESEYFRFRVYGNGNVHLELKRMDLVAGINRRCGGNMVPQAASA